MKKMNGTTFPSNPCYLPIYEPNPYGGLERYTRVWSNFIQAGGKPWVPSALERVKNWNGTVVNDVIVFNTEQDKMWFILRWS